MEGGSSAVQEVQHDHRVGRFAAPATPQERSHAAERQPANEREAQQYADQNKGVDHQIADVVPARRNPFVERYVRLITDQGQEFFSRVGIGRGQNHGHQRAAALDHGARDLLELGGLQAGAEVSGS